MPLQVSTFSRIISDGVNSGYMASLIFSEVTSTSLWVVCMSFFHLKLSDYHALNITGNVLPSIIFNPWYAAASADVSCYFNLRSLMLFQTIMTTFSDVTARAPLLPAESVSVCNLYSRNIYLTVQIIHSSHIQAFLAGSIVMEVKILRGGEW